jgi:mercuric ion transport protein
VARNEAGRAHRAGWFGAGAALAGIASAACCVGPALVLFGFGGLASLRVLEPYRPAFIAAAVVLLGYALYRTYRRPVADAACCPPHPRRAQKVILWMASALVLVGVLFPYILALFA